MSTALNPSFTTPSQHFARQRVESRINLPRLFAAIDADPGIVGAGVVYIDSDFNVITLREFRPICSRTVKRVILRETLRHTTPQQFVEHSMRNTRESRLFAEAFNAGVSCAGAVFGWVVMFGAAGASPITGGVTLPVAAVGYSAAMASSMQCGVGAFRTYNEIRNPALNDELDSDPWYNAASMLLDGISLLGVGASAAGVAKYVSVARGSNGKTLWQLRKGLNNQERYKLTRELLKFQDPRLSVAAIKAKQKLGELPRILTPTQIRNTTLFQVADALGAVTGFGGSAVSGNLGKIADGTFAGSIKSIGVGLYEELADD